MAKDALNEFNKGINTKQTFTLGSKAMAKINEIETASKLRPDESVNSAPESSDPPLTTATDFGSVVPVAPTQNQGTPK
jgi:hypothetical protein